MNNNLFLRAYIKSLRLILPVVNISFEDETIIIVNKNISRLKFKFADVILMRCTGEKDKEGILIYEYDKVSYSSIFGDINIGIVRWSNDLLGWIIEDFGTLCDLKKDIIVIGHMDF